MVAGGTHLLGELEQQVLDGIRAVVAKHLDWDAELPLAARLIEDLALDSIRLLTLATEVENHFRIILEPEDESAIVTVADLVTAVAGKLRHPRDEAVRVDSP
jgi:acyl carrier protein